MNKINKINVISQFRGMLYGQERRKHMGKSRTGTENGFRVVRDGTREPLRQHVEIYSRMFQFNQMKKKRSKGKKR